MPPPASNIPSPAQRAEANGLSSLSDAELLTLAMIEPGGWEWHARLDAFALLLQAYGNLTDLTAATIPAGVEDETEGFTLRLQAIRHLHLRLAAEEARTGAETPLTGTQAVAAGLIPLLGAATEETLVVLPTDRALQPLRTRTVAIGSGNLVAAAPAQLLRPAIEVNATSIFIAHNHPCGDPTPSCRDWEFTRRMALAASTLDIELQDHLVIAGTRYRSMRQEAPDCFDTGRSLAPNPTP